jgi:hypothetical protein
MRAIILWCLLAATAAGQEIRLDGPTSPLAPREYAQILVHDLSESDLVAASIEWTPRDETTLIPARLWGGQPFLLFSARKPGEYTIVVTINAWRNNLDAAVDATRRAAIIDPALYQRLESVAADLRQRYPVRTGTCTVEIAGTIPEPPAPPIPPPDPPPKVADQVTIVVESQDTLDATQLEIVHGEAVRSAATAAGLEFRCVDTDATGPDVAEVQHALDAARGQSVPRLVFAAAGQVTESIPLPATVAATVSLLQSRGATKR